MHHYDLYSVLIGVAMAIHSGRAVQSLFDIMDILSSHGVSGRAISMSHMERTFADSPNDMKKMCEFSERGCYINHSLFGKECSHYQYDTNIDFPSDAQKIQRVKALTTDGHMDHVLLSHDVVCRNEWTCYGGNGYVHLLNNIAQKFVDRGIEKNTVDKIMKDNPMKWLTCQK